MANERRCIVCGKNYVFCPRCPGGANLPSWLSIYDKEECKSIFDVCSSYKNGHLKKGDALIKLRSISLPQHLNDEYQKLVDEILFVEKKPPKRKKKDFEEEVFVEEPEDIVVNEDLA